MQVKEICNQVKERLTDLKTNYRKNGVLMNQNDIDYLKKIVTRSGVKYHDLYYINASRYFTCFQLFDYPQFDKRNLLEPFLQLDNVLITMDCSHITKNEYDTMMNKNVKNNEGDSELAKKYKERKQLIKSNAILDEFDNHIESTGDAVKTITVRLYVYDLTIEGLQKRLNVILDKMESEGMYSAIQTDNLRADYKALTSYSDPVRKMVASETVAKMMLIDNASKVCASAPVLGYTKAGVYANDFNAFMYDSYNIVSIGSTGCGKSAFMKNLGERVCLTRDIQYLLDIDEEYKEYCEELDIPRISMSEENYMNMLQIYYVSNNDMIIRNEDIMTKIDSMKNRFATYHDCDGNSTVVLQYALLLEQVYSDFVGKKITEYEYEDWPVHNDVLALLLDKVKKGDYPEEAKSDLYELELALSDMIKVNGALFNKHTNVQVDLNHDVCFDLSFLRNTDGVKLKASYLTQILEFLGQGLFMNRLYNETLAKENGVFLKDLPRPYRALRIKIDEFLQYSLDRYFLYKTDSFLKLMRKCYAGLEIIVHTTSDLNKSNDVNGDLLKGIFELCTNKIIGRIDGESKETLKSLITGLTDADVNTIAKFKKGRNGARQFLIIDDHKDKFWVTTILSEKQKEYFRGGV